VLVAYLSSTQINQELKTHRELQSNCHPAGLCSCSVCGSAPPLTQLNYLSTDSSTIHHRNSLVNARTCLLHCRAYSNSQRVRNIILEIEIFSRVLILMSLVNSPNSIINATVSKLCSEAVRPAEAWPVHFLTLWAENCLNNPLQRPFGTFKTIQPANVSDASTGHATHCLNMLISNQYNTID